MIGSSAPGGGWENYSMADEHMDIANLFVNNFTKIVKVIFSGARGSVVGWGTML
jgi:hypothetical protein